MSGKLVGMVFDFFPGRTSELLLAVKLADNAHEDGTSIYPSVAELARLTRLSERTVQYQLTSMQEIGWLVLVKHARGGGRAGGNGRPREYRIHPDWVRQFDRRTPDDQRPVWVAQPRKSEKEMGAKIAPISGGKRVQPDAEMGASIVAEMGASIVAPEPSLTAKEPNTPLPPTGVAPGFDTLAAGYPRQADMVKARREFERINPGEALLRTMLQSVAEWVRSPEWQREDGRYVPKLANWLRHERWRDKPGFSPPPAPPPAPPPPARPAAPMPPEVRAKVDAILGPRRKRVATVEAGG